MKIEDIKVDDEVIVVDNTTCHKFKIDEVVTVTEIYNGVKLRATNGKDSWYLRDKDIVPVDDYIPPHRYFKVVLKSMDWLVSFSIIKEDGKFPTEKELIEESMNDYGAHNDFVVISVVEMDKQDFADHYEKTEEEL